MKKTVTIAFTTLLLALRLFSQPTSSSAPFVVKGKLANCREKYLTFFFNDENGEVVSDTAHLDPAGNFYLQTRKVKEPQITSMQQNDVQINDFFVAPGYELTITGDAKNFQSLCLTKKISGIGSESNRYRVMLDSISFARLDTVYWWQLNEAALINYIKKDFALRDSIRTVVFGEKKTSDTYLIYFKRVVELNNLFMNLYYLVTYATVHNYDEKQAHAFLQQNFDTSILNNLSRDEYLSSSVYKNMLIADGYLTFLVNLDYQKDSSLRKQGSYKLEKASKAYSGRVKEFVLYQIMKGYIQMSTNFQMLNEYKENFESFLSSFSNPFYKESLKTKYAEREAQLIKTQIGAPAPAFTLENSSGKIYCLADFKGKVVYLDLWASWCEPCRAEVPSLKRLSAKYKNENRIVFISVAVRDGINTWKEALRKDNPPGIQLLDKDETVWKSYVPVGIPKFIIIDKLGNIVSFDAPRPSSGNEIETVLAHEVKK